MEVGGRVASAAERSRGRANREANTHRANHRREPLRIEPAPVGSPRRESTGCLRLAFSSPRQLLRHAFAVLGPRGLVLAGFQGAGMGLAELLVARLAAVAWLGRSKLGGWRRLMHALAPFIVRLGLARFDIPVERFATRLVLPLGAVHGIRGRVFSCGFSSGHCGGGSD